MTEAIKTVRIVAASQVGVDQNVHKTVNIITTSKYDPAEQIPTRLQQTGATGPLAFDAPYPTVVAGPTGASSISPTNSLPTIFVSGYNGPV
jgi:hypothetical protein